MRISRSGFEILSLMAMAMACDLTGFVMPLIVAALVSNHGMSDAQVGFVATAQLMSCALLSFALAPRVRKLGPRATIALGLLLVGGGNAVTLIAHDPGVLIPARLAAGLGEALVNVVVAVLVARRADPDRGFAMIAIGITSGAVAVFVAAPLLTPMVGKDGIFWALAALPALVLPLLAGVQTRPLAQTDPLPDPAVAHAQAAPSAFFGVSVPGLALLAGVVGFGVAGNAIFIFVERIGEGLGITYNEMVHMMLWVTVWTAIGPVVARMIGVRFGRMPVLAFAFIGLAISDPMMGAPANPTVLFIGLNLGGFCLLFAQPFYQGLMVAMDATGRLITLSRGVIAVGSAITPSIASLMLLSGGGFPAMGYWSSVVAVLSLGLVYYAHVSTQRRAAASAPVGALQLK
ncbi:MFS transporter [Phenylobacterium sp.]|uniref:MFS transporter n=1 Tax=Phenylobacterium sp. TaxID=1871053 RepID=UPI0035AE8326